MPWGGLDCPEDQPVENSANMSDNVTHEDRFTNPGRAAAAS